MKDGLARRWSDQRIEKIMGHVLRFGVACAAVVILAGAAAYLTTHRQDPIRYGSFQGETPHLRHVATIAGDALALDPLAIMQFGLLLLIATPVARVVFSLIAFMLQGDLVYVAVTVIVLSILVYSLASGAT